MGSSEAEIAPIRRLQLAELGALDMVVAICEACDLRYYMLGGTLLGAVRDSGFIPWDDDIDIALPREDYETFKVVAAHVLEEPYALECYEETPGYRYSWARVTNSTVSESIGLANKERVECAWVDLIPLDGMPDLPVSRLFHKARLAFWWNLNQIVQFDELVDQHRDRSRLGAALVRLASSFKWVGSFVDYHTCLEGVNRALKSCPYDGSETTDIINYLAAFGFKETFPRASFGSGRDYVFEGRSVKGPADSEQVLTTIYGPDYMTPPPVEEQNKHQGHVC